MAAAVEEVKSEKEVLMKKRRESVQRRVGNVPLVGGVLKQVVVAKHATKELEKEHATKTQLDEAHGGAIMTNEEVVDRLIARNQAPPPRPRMLSPSVASPVPRASVHLRRASTPRAAALLIQRTWRAPSVPPHRSSSPDAAPSTRRYLPSCLRAQEVTVTAAATTIQARMRGSIARRRSTAAKQGSAALALEPRFGEQNALMPNLFRTALQSPQVGYTQLHGLPPLRPPHQQQAHQGGGGGGGAPRHRRRHLQRSAADQLAARAGAPRPRAARRAAPPALQHLDTLS